MKGKVKISVRNLVELMLRSGDLVSSFSGSSRAVEGTKGHQLVQKSYEEGYTAEVSISYIVEQEEISLEISGRIDGIIQKDGEVIVDEIKTTTMPIYEIEEDLNPLHWAQAKCYAYIYAKQEGMESIFVQITYYQIDTKEIKSFKKVYTISQLSSFFYDLANKYLAWTQKLIQWNECRDISIQQLPFPFQTYRKGQRELAVGVYTTIRDGKKIFIQAPTGIGKTVATLFPAIKALGEGHISKIFYLTAKTITRTIAESALENMKQQGLKCKSLTLTAKDKICLEPGSSCNPEQCRFAKGHFDRINDAIAALFQEDSFTQDKIEKIAREFRVCPFELSLDMSLWSDIVICDYNYVFDPRVYLKRFFADTQDEYAFLIDEAHNLVDRAREMFSAELYKKNVLELKKEVKGKYMDLSKALSKLNTYLIGYRRICESEEKGCYVNQDQPKELSTLLREFIRGSEKWLLKNKESDIYGQVLELYFSCMGFIRTVEGYDEHYITYYEKIGTDVKVKLFCIDPSKLMQEALKRGKATVFFSATLSPIEYFLQTLLGEEEAGRIRFASPFPRENLCLLIENTIATRYKQRELTYKRIIDLIVSVVSGKRGNYLVFFPSYEYMNKVYDQFNEENKEFETVIQHANMTEKEREEFLKSFSEEKQDSLIGFAVMGGIFGEGIDLAGERLSGAIIIGVGLPQICLERELIREYFQKVNNHGFEYAYTFPGMNKVMQAVGRVIRTETDRGVVVLVDERFGTITYKSLYPREWMPIEKIKDCLWLEERIKRFWSI